MSCSALTRLPPATNFVGTESFKKTDAQAGTLLESGNLGSSLSETLNRLLRLHENFVETQGQAIQSRLQAFTAEQAELRALLECQHREVLQKLEVVDLKGACDPLENNDEHGRGKDHEDAVVTADKAAKDLFLRGSCTNITNPSGMLGQSVSGVSKYAGGNILDIHSLPTHWVTHEQKSDDEDAKRSHFFARLRAFGRSPHFDIMMMIVLVLNLIVMYVEMEMRSSQVAKIMGDREKDTIWVEAKDIFASVEFAFALCFFLEAILRLYVYKRRYIGRLHNACDCTLVSTSFVTTCILVPAGVLDESPKFVLARLLMLLRIVRLLKVVRLTKAFSELRIMARALYSSFWGLFWSFVILAFVITGGGLFLFAFLVVYMEDGSKPIEHRKWVYENFGTATLSVMAVFEATFTGAWWRYSRPMIIDINPYLSIFWVLYVLCVNYASMRLIGALFLKHTMDAATWDREKMSMMKLKERQKYANKIREIFKEADTSRDGKLSAKEFHEMMHDAHVGDCFESLDLEVAEVATLWMLLSSDSGEADYEEFLEGAMKLKHSARTIDVVQLFHANGNLLRQLQIVYDAVCDLDNKIGQKGWRK